jgi:hypothetical protein
VADVLSQLSDWAGSLHDLGEAEVKHGTKVHITNLFSKDIGNPELPVKLARRPSTAPAALHADHAVVNAAPTRGRKGIWIGGTAAAAVVVAALVFYSGILGKAPAPPPEKTVETGGSGKSTEPPIPPPPIKTGEGRGSSDAGAGATRQDAAKTSTGNERKAVSEPSSQTPKGGTEQKAGVAASEPVAPPPAIQTPSAAAPAAAAEPPELQQLRERTIQLASRATAVNTSMQRIEQQQSRQGLSMRSDMAASKESMLYLMDEARKALNSGNVESLKRNLGLAERQIEKLETFLGR